MAADVSLRSACQPYPPCVYILSLASSSANTVLHKQSAVHGSRDLLSDEEVVRLSSAELWPCTRIVIIRNVGLIHVLMIRLFCKVPGCNANLGVCIRLSYGSVLSEVLQRPAQAEFLFPKDPFLPRILRFFPALDCVMQKIGGLLGSHVKHNPQVCKSFIMCRHTSVDTEVLTEKSARLLTICSTIILPPLRALPLPQASHNAKEPVTNESFILALHSVFQDFGPMCCEPNCYCVVQLARLLSQCMLADPSWIFSFLSKDEKMFDCGESVQTLSSAPSVTSLEGTNRCSPVSALSFAQSSGNRMPTTSSPSLKALTRFMHRECGCWPVNEDLPNDVCPERFMGRIVVAGDRNSVSTTAVLKVLTVAFGGGEKLHSAIAGRRNNFLETNLVNIRASPVPLDEVNSARVMGEFCYIGDISEPTIYRMVSVDKISTTVGETLLKDEMLTKQCCSSGNSACRKFEGSGTMCSILDVEAKRSFLAYVEKGEVHRMAYHSEWVSKRLELFHRLLAASLITSASLAECFVRMLETMARQVYATACVISASSTPATNAIVHLVSTLLAVPLSHVPLLLRAAILLRPEIESKVPPIKQLVLGNKSPLHTEECIRVKTARDMVSIANGLL